MKTSPAATGYSPITTPNTRAGRVDVFVVGVANKIYNGKWNGSAFAWSLWSIYPSGFALVSKAAAASWCPGRMDVMVVDANGTSGSAGAPTSRLVPVRSGRHHRESLLRMVQGTW